MTPPDQINAKELYPTEVKWRSEVSDSPLPVHLKLESEINSLSLDDISETLEDISFAMGDRLSSGEMGIGPNRSAINVLTQNIITLIDPVKFIDILEEPHDWVRSFDVLTELNKLYKDPVQQALRIIAWLGRGNLSHNEKKSLMRGLAHLLKKDKLLPFLLFSSLEIKNIDEKTRTELLSVYSKVADEKTSLKNLFKDLGERKNRKPKIKILLCTLGAEFNTKKAAVNERIIRTMFELKRLYSILSIDEYADECAKKYRYKNGDDFIKIICKLLDTTFIINHDSLDDLSIGISETLKYSFYYDLKAGLSRLDDICFLNHEQKGELTAILLNLQDKYTSCSI